MGLGCILGNENVCSLPLRTGHCRARFWVWGFNSATGQCERFIYGGCGGNRNRFEEKVDCQRACVGSSHPEKHDLPSNEAITSEYPPFEK
ncbi:WAP Kazal immunoglobulin Kunitz and NTR domain-containing protein 2 [Taenia solium]|eukprot:TsM_000133800 transcript=TsM_000133800 gene=TsM_000133800